MHSLPVFLRLAGRPVVLLGDGEAAEAKRRLIVRAGGVPVGEDAPHAALAVVALTDEGEAQAAVARLRRGVCWSMRSIGRRCAISPGRQ